MFGQRLLPPPGSLAVASVRGLWVVSVFRNGVLEMLGLTSNQVPTTTVVGSPTIVPTRPTGPAVQTTNAASLHTAAALNFAAGLAAVGAMMI